MSQFFPENPEFLYDQYYLNSVFNITITQDHNQDCLIKKMEKERERDLDGRHGDSL